MNPDHFQMGGPEDLKTALVTGATGALGSAAAMALARSGWKLGLVFHKNEEAAHRLQDQLMKTGAPVALVSGDLENPAKEVPRIVAEVRRTIGHPHLFVHAAGLPVTSSPFHQLPQDLEKMFQVHVASFLAFTAELLPEMLRTQNGILVALLSQAISPPLISGWQAYTVAKSALAQAVNEMAFHYGRFGIRSLSVLAGAFRSENGPSGDGPEEVREAIRRRWPIGVEPERIAKEILQMIEDPQIRSGSVLAIDGVKGPRIYPSLHWSYEEASGAKEESPAPTPKGSPGLLPRLRPIFKNLFGVKETHDLESAALGDIEGWDSLGHMQLVMEIESAFNIRFSSEEVSTLHSVKGILDSLQKHLHP